MSLPWPGIEHSSNKKKRTEAPIDNESHYTSFRNDFMKPPNKGKYREIKNNEIKINYSKNKAPFV